MVAVDYGQASPLVQVLADENEALLDLADGKVPETTLAPTTSRPPAPIAQLTGGDPDLTCVVIPEVLTVVTAYAEALLSQPTEHTAIVDLVYSPWLVSALLGTTSPSPPRSWRHGPSRCSTGPSWPCRRSASTTPRPRTSSPPASWRRTPRRSTARTLEQRVQATLLQHVKQPDLDKAAATLGPTPGDLFALVNLGEVTPEVARASGYDCIGG